MSRRLDDAWVYDLDPMHRAILTMVSDRLTDHEWSDMRPDSLSLAQLSDKLRELMRGEPIRIPAGTPGVPCRFCQSTIYWLKSRAMKAYRESVSVAGDDCRAPTATQAGEGFAHLVDCPHSGLLVSDVVDRKAS